MPKTEPAEPETIKCHDCGSEVPFDESLGAETGSKGKWEDVCRECYNDIVSTCQLCGDEDIMPSDVSPFILVKWELGGTDNRPPGIYKIISRPFLSIPMIGSGSLHGRDVLFVDCLPKRDYDYEISGHTCKKCAAPYANLFAKTYGKDPQRYTGQGYNKKLLVIEREHTARSICARPGYMKDIEEDYNGYHWKRLKEFYRLPNLKPFNDWLFKEHNGVKVYRCYLESSGWLTLRPEPRYRNTHSNSEFIFAASGLPTWKREGEYQYEHPKEDREAVIAAIDQGILTQDGTFDPATGERIHCR